MSTFWTTRRITDEALFLGVALAMSWLLDSPAVILGYVIVNALLMANRYDQYRGRT